MSDRIELAGQKIGRWSVLRYAGDNRWHCVCECGNERIVYGQTLRHGKSVGCVRCRNVDTGQKRRKNTYSPAFNGLIDRYKGNAKTRGLLFLLTDDDCLNLFSEPCHYCGIEPYQVYTRREHTYTYNGIDRVDSKKDYTRGNVVPCCGICNQAKMDMPYTTFISWVRRCSKHLEKKEILLDGSNFRSVS